MRDSPRCAQFRSSPGSRFRFRFALGKRLTRLDWLKTRHRKNLMTVSVERAKTDDRAKQQRNLVDCTARLRSARHQDRKKPGGHEGLIGQLLGQLAHDRYAMTGDEVVIGTRLKLAVGALDDIAIDVCSRKGI